MDSVLINQLYTKLQFGNPIVDAFIIFLLTNSISYVLRNAKKIWDNVISLSPISSKVIVTTIPHTMRSEGLLNSFYFDVEWYLDTKVIDKRCTDVVRGCKGDDQIRFPVLPGSDYVVFWDTHKFIFRWHQQNEWNDKAGRYINKDNYFSIKYKGKRIVLESFVRHIHEEYHKHQELQRQHSWYPIAYIYQHASRQFCAKLISNPKNHKTIIMNQKRKHFLFEDISKFLKGKKSYTEKGLTWKRGYLFHGPPGGGKTSLVCAMANFTKSHMYIINLEDFDDDCHFQEVLWKVHISKNETIMLVFEDIDCFAPSNDRESSKKLENIDTMNQEEDSVLSKQKRTGVTLNGLLNMLDGLIARDGIIVVMTTNHVSKLDPALIRPGRIDVTMQLENASCEEIAQCYKLYTGEDVHVSPHAAGKYTIAEICNKVQLGANVCDL